MAPIPAIEALNAIAPRLTSVGFLQNSFVHLSVDNKPRVANAEAPTMQILWVLSEDANDVTCS